MIGDKLNIEQRHIDAAGSIMELVLLRIEECEGKFILTIAGESGAGKSEIASVLCERLCEAGLKSVILQQDDYFVYPPKTNASMRKKDIGHVGLSEVRLGLLDENLRAIIDGEEEINKPLVNFEGDRITKETIKLEGVKVVVVEGTYTSVLKNVHKHIFIDQSYVDTREIRKRRAREEQDEFLEKILEIEHKIISSHKREADIIVTSDYKVEANEAGREQD